VKEGYQYWYDNELSLAPISNKDTTMVLQQGETYFDIRPEKYIGIQSWDINGFSFTITPEKAKRKLYISNYEKDNTTILSVIQGKAKVNYKNEIKEIPEGHTMIINDTSCAVYKNENINQDTSWITGTWSFTNKPLHYVLNRMARKFGYCTKCKDAEGYTIPCEQIFNIPITGTYNLKQSTIIKVLEYIAQKVNFKYKIEGDLIIIN
jgi:hypothetical protein